MSSQPLPFFVRVIISLMRKGPLTDAEGKALRKAPSLRIS
jgi:hypothetical protein